MSQGPALLYLPAPHQDGLLLAQVILDSGLWKAAFSLFMDSLMPASGHAHCADVRTEQPSFRIASLSSPASVSQIPSPPQDSCSGRCSPHEVLQSPTYVARGLVHPASASLPLSRERWGGFLNLVNVSVL